jgi:hypothetical protein
MSLLAFLTEPGYTLYIPRSSTAGAEKESVFGSVAAFTG